MLCLPSRARAVSFRSEGSNANETLFAARVLSQSSHCSWIVGMEGFPFPIVELVGEAGVVCTGDERSSSIEFGEGPAGAPCRDRLMSLSTLRSDVDVGGGVTLGFELLANSPFRSIKVTEDLRVTLRDRLPASSVELLPTEYNEPRKDKPLACQEDESPGERCPSAIGSSDLRGLIPGGGLNGDLGMPLTFVASPRSLRKDSPARKATCTVSFQSLSSAIISECSTSR